jgi:hypothetical protein
LKRAVFQHLLISLLLQKVKEFNTDFLLAQLSVSQFSYILHRLEAYLDIVSGLPFKENGTSELSADMCTSFHT